MPFFSSFSDIALLVYIPLWLILNLIQIYYCIYLNFSLHSTLVDIKYKSRRTTRYTRQRLHSTLVDIKWQTRTQGHSRKDAVYIPLWLILN